MNTNAIQVVEPPSKHESDHYGGYTDPRVIVALVAAFIAGWVGHIFANCREAKNRVITAKNTFLTFISRKIAEIPNSDIADFYAKTTPDIRDSVFGLMPLLSNTEAMRLKTAWEAYSQIDGQLSNDDKEFQELKRMAAHIDRIPETPTSYSVLKQRMEKLYESVR